MAKEGKQLELRDASEAGDSDEESRLRSTPRAAGTPSEFRPATVAEPKELRGWYMFDWANSVREPPPWRREGCISPRASPPPAPPPRI